MRLLLVLSHEFELVQNRQIDLCKRDHPTWYVLI